jgi:hypothetical protein
VTPDIWLHEWAHALLGHVTFASSELRIAQLHEFSTERVGEQVIDHLGYPRNEVLQSLEIGADEFAVQYCVRQILWGRDPIGDIAGPKIDLVDRLMIFSAACSVFAVMWSRAEQQYSPDMSFYPSREMVLMSNNPDREFVAFKTTHPPAALRYYRFCGFRDDLAREWDQLNNTKLMVGVSASSGFFVCEYLSAIDKDFHQVQVETPGVFKTPTMKCLEAYQARLLGMGPKVAPLLKEMGFVPTVDP